MKLVNVKASTFFVAIGTMAVIACGSASSTKDMGSDCPAGQARCPLCGGGVGPCSTTCPGYACPEVTDASGAGDASPPSDGAAPSDASGVLDTGPAVDGHDGDGDAAVESADAGGCGACTAAQVCVQQSCGGGTAPACDRLDDAGGCAAGWTYSASCDFITSPSTGPGCRPPPCVDPPPFCADIPSSCGSTPTCTCLNNVCQSNGGDGQSCIVVTGGKVSCGGA